jgi:hypothetical protein
VSQRCHGLVPWSVTLAANRQSIASTKFPSQNFQDLLALQKQPVDYGPDVFRREPFTVQLPEPPQLRSEAQIELGDSSALHDEVCKNRTFNGDDDSNGKRSTTGFRIRSDIIDDRTGFSPCHYGL